ncbi:MAG: dipicolinate synthase subunit DpsA [Oscillospiraceae bacterium]|nr:dipicolinate synthase subunit DpsA [Oscillospiraceae bacterium]
MRFSLVGGDARQAGLAGLIAADGHAVSTFGVDAPAAGTPAETLADCLRGADCIVLPIPVTLDRGTLNAPALRCPPTAEEIWRAARPGQVLAGGRIPEALWRVGAERGAVVWDVLTREDFAARNAVPTAEGALQIAMENMPITLHGARCLVVGYGRIGKVLSRDLLSLGARVTASARRQADLAWIEIVGGRAVHTQALETVLGGCDVVFNTVPAPVLTEDRLKLLPPDCLCIDLASAPGGVDFDAAHRLGLRCVWALGLPGKVAPRTAGLILRDTLYHIMTEGSP